MNKSVTLTITRSSHPEFDLFADLRDTTGGRYRQMTTRRGTREDMVNFEREVRHAAKISGVTVTVIDEAV
jgi:hypothetical protein